MCTCVPFTGHCSNVHCTVLLWAFESLWKISCVNLESLAHRAFDHLNCQILTQIFLKSNAQEAGHGWFWNWLGHKSRLWGVLGRAWTIDELDDRWQSVSITDIDYWLIINQLILLVNVVLWLLSVIGYPFHQLSVGTDQ